MHNTEIFKIQKAFNNDNVLIYNKGKKTIGQFPITRQLKKMFGNKEKIYVNGIYNEKTTKVDILSLADIKNIDF